MYLGGEPIGDAMMSHSDPPAEPRHLLPSCWGCCLLSTGSSLAQGRCLSKVAPSGDSLHPITGQGGVQRPSPVISALDISEKSPQLPNSLGSFGTASRSASTLPNTASLTSSPRIRLHTNHHFRSTVISRPLASCPPGPGTRHLSVPSPNAWRKAPAPPCSDYNYRRASWGLSLSS